MRRRGAACGSMGTGGFVRVVSSGRAYAPGRTLHQSTRGDKERGHQVPYQLARNSTPSQSSIRLIRRAFKVFRVLFFGKFFSVFVGGRSQAVCEEVGWGVPRRSEGGRRAGGHRPKPLKSVPYCAILCHFSCYCKVTSVPAAFGKSCHRWNPGPPSGVPQPGSENSRGGTF